jgi:pimeloyl-ACP methyl ester carboxylesterase
MAELLAPLRRRLPQSSLAPILTLTACTALLLTRFAWRRWTYKPELLPPPPKESPYRYYLANETSAVIALQDGRQIGYAQYGDPNGKPVICLHGIIGSRLENFLFDANARKLGIRIIGIDRPGIGLSDPDPRPITERTLLNHAQDVEALATHLKLKDYAIIGTSGGGPYALACAYALPSTPSAPKLKAVSIVTGLGLWDMPQAWFSALVFLNRHLDLSWALRLLMASSPVWNMTVSDDERMEELRKAHDLKKVHPADAEFARYPEYPDWQRLFLLSSREAVRQGWRGFHEDSAMLSRRPPGFRVEDIRSELPVQLWYGSEDRNVAPEAGVETERRLKARAGARDGDGKVELHMLGGETHGSTQVKYQKGVLEDLLRAMESY